MLRSPGTKEAAPGYRRHRLPSTHPPGHAGTGSLPHIHQAIAGTGSFPHIHQAMQAQDPFCTPTRSSQAQGPFRMSTRPSQAEPPYNAGSSLSMHLETETHQQSAPGEVRGSCLWQFRSQPPVPCLLCKDIDSHVQTPQGIGWTIHTEHPATQAESCRKLATLCLSNIFLDI